MSDVKDLFSHKTISNNIKAIFERDFSQGTYVIALNGAWGTGKTNLMNMVLSELDPYEHIIVNFNAWRYAGVDDIKRALLINIIESCRKYIDSTDVENYLGWNDAARKKALEKCNESEKSLYTAFSKTIPGEITIDTGKILKTGANMALKFIPWGNIGNDFIEHFFVKRNDKGRVDDNALDKDDIEALWGIFNRSSTTRDIEKVTGIEQFRKTFESLVNAILKGESDETEICKHDKKIKLIVAIDDLDRCLPEHVLDILEAIKLFVDYPNTYFMIAMDGTIVQKGLDMRYHSYESVSIRAKDYYEKMIDLSFNMPGLLDEKIYSYIDSLSSYSSNYKDLYKSLSIALGTNLRAWQRFIEKTDISRKIIEDIVGSDIFDDSDLFDCFIKLQCIAYVWPEVYRSINDKEKYLTLESEVSNISDYPKKSLQEIQAILVRDGISKDIVDFILDKKVLDFLKVNPIKMIVDAQERSQKLDYLLTFDVIN